MLQGFFGGIINKEEKLQNFIQPAVVVYYTSADRSYFYQDYLVEPGNLLRRGFENGLGTDHQRIVDGKIKRSINGNVLPGIGVHDVQTSLQNPEEIVFAA